MTELWVDIDDLDDPTLVDAWEAAATASSILYMLSGRKYPGHSTVTEIYECQSNHGMCGLSAHNQARRYAGGIQVGGHELGLKLRGTPVHSVEELRAGGRRDLIGPEGYVLLDRKYLRPRGAAGWNPCGTLEVTYTYGMRPPVAGRRAARILANELLKGRHDPDNCALPDRVTSISRQGVSFAILDPQDFLAEGRTGLYEVDLFLKSSNPDKARAKARVFVPDAQRGYTVRRVT